MHLFFDQVHYPGWGSRLVFAHFLWLVYIMADVCIIVCFIYRHDEWVMHDSIMEDTPENQIKALAENLQSKNKPEYVHH